MWTQQRTITVIYKGKNRQKTFAKIQKRLIKSILENDEKYQPPLESIKRGISESVPY